MASRIVMNLIVAAARPIGATIRNGKPLPTMCGALLGAVLGANFGLIKPELTVFGVLLGAIVGAGLGAILNKRPPLPLGARADDEPVSIGAVLQAWTFEAHEFKSLTVLLEHALYVVREDSAPWETVLRKLADGEDPGLPLGDLILLDELVQVEMRNPNATEIQLVHGALGRTKRRGVDFQTIAERDALIASIERIQGKPFDRQELPMETFRSIRPPVILAVIVALLFGGAAYLSAYWTQNPPPPPRGKTEQDFLVRFMIWAGPGTIILAGAALFLATLGWLTFRVLHPPRLQVLQVRDV
jgi:hypothetical protein